MSEQNEKITMAEIERAALAYGATHRELAQLVFQMNGVIQAAMREGMPRLRRLIKRCDKDKQALEMLVDAGRDLFKRKKTSELHGIKVGLQKPRGGLVIPDPERTCQLIKRHFSASYDSLVRTKREPDRQALNSLEAASLKKVGVQISSTTDLVVVRPVESRTGKLVKALMAGHGKGEA